jgi:hypothetical protein
LTICASYSWKMTLNVGLDVSFDNNIQEWKGIQQKAGEVYVTNYYTECLQKLMYIHVLITTETV